MDKTKILFVCLGNICHSPAAEGVMKGMIAKRDIASYFEIDSAGTAAYHAGEGADARMKRHALQRGYQLTSISRKVVLRDFDYFDLIVAMDNSNFDDLQYMAKSELQKAKIVKMTDFALNCQHTSVPDPYYGGAEGFELVLDILEDACSGLIDNVLNGDK